MQPIGILMVKLFATYGDQHKLDEAIRNAYSESDEIDVLKNKRIMLNRELKRINDKIGHLVRALSEVKYSNEYVDEEILRLDERKHQVQVEIDHLTSKINLIPSRQTINLVVNDMQKMFTPKMRKALHQNQIKRYHSSYMYFHSMTSDDRKAFLT